MLELVLNIILWGLVGIAAVVCAFLFIGWIVLAVWTVVAGIKNALT